jgi:hypothetical protein
MDFYFADNDPLTWSGPAEKAKGNLAAIQLVRQLQAENRPATSEEQARPARPSSKPPSIRQLDLDGCRAYRSHGTSWQPLWRGLRVRLRHTRPCPPAIP